MVAQTKGFIPGPCPHPLHHRSLPQTPSWPEARCSRLGRVGGNACLHCGEVGGLKAQEECRKPPGVKAVGDMLPGCDQLNLHEISTPVLSSQAAATWDPSLVSQLLYLLFHDTNLLLDPDRKLERTGCLKAKCY